jgi:hypothetical protein
MPWGFDPTANTRSYGHEIASAGQSIGLGSFRIFDTVPAPISSAFATASRVMPVSLTSCAGQ